MTEIRSPYSIGDWVVHHTYGIGQIQKIEVKPIHGEQISCFRVKTKDTVFWFPQDQSENPRIRPVATPEIVYRAEKELQITVRELDLDREMWRERIEDVKLHNDLIAISQLVRDLTILRTQRKLNQTEVEILSRFTDRLIREWSAAMNKNVETTQIELDHYLQVHRERGSV